jgi:hypothetical protein
MPKVFVVDGATLKCSFGTDTCKLIVLPRKEMLTGKYMANITDSKIVNIPSFNLCILYYPPLPCTPACDEWISGKPDFLVEEKDALLDSSVVVCMICGGMITVTDCGQVGEIVDESFMLMSKSQHERPDSGLSDLSDEEVSRRARDKSLSGEERRRYQREEKIRGLRNRQKRQSNFSLDWDSIGEAVGLTGVGLIIYLIISEGSRIIFPPRNLIPIL